MGLKDDIGAILDKADSERSEQALTISEQTTQIIALVKTRDELAAKLQIANETVGSRDTEIAALKATISRLEARIRELENPTPSADPHISRKPKSFFSWQAAVSALGLPTDANYVVWKAEWTHLEQAFAALGTNDVLVLPERAEPYLVDSSKGFIAAGVKDMEYISDADYVSRSYTSKYVSGVVPVNSSSNRLWFEMARSRRGILGLGPGAVIKASKSGWKGVRQPNNNMIVTYTDGSKGTLVGVQNKLIGSEHHSPVYANFAMAPEDLGTVAYNAIGISSSQSGNFFMRNVWIDRAMSGFAGIPNGEAGGIILGNGKYDIENVLITTDASSSSPIMFNRNTGGRMKNVWLGMPAVGMLTYWRCSGVNELIDVVVHAPKAGINLEEEYAGFVLNWTGGAINVGSKGGAFHLNMNPSGGSQKIALKNVAISGYYGDERANNGKLAAHVYKIKDTDPARQRKADVTWDGGQILYLPEANWIG